MDVDVSHTKCRHNLQGFELSPRLREQTSYRVSFGSSVNHISWKEAPLSGDDQNGRSKNHVALRGVNRRSSWIRSARSRFPLEDSSVFN